MEGRYAQTNKKSSSGPSLISKDKDLPQIPDYNINMSTTKLVNTIKGITDQGVRLARNMRTPSRKRYQSLHYEFHTDYGYGTKECKASRLKVAHLFKKGMLVKFLTDKGKQNFGKNRRGGLPPMTPSPKRVINVIIGG